MNNRLTVGLAVVVALLGGFYGGFRYESGRVTATASAAVATPTQGADPNRYGGTGSGFAGAGGNGFGGGRGNAGTITNLTATGFTLHSANGTDTAVTFAAGATVRKTVSGQLADLEVNTAVAVAGTRDAAGNLVATAITLLPVASPSPVG